VSKIIVTLLVTLHPRPITDHRLPITDYLTQAMTIFKATIFLITVTFLTQASGQKITFYKTFGGMGFEMDTVTLSMHDVMERMKVNPVAYDEIKRARSNYSAAGVLGFTGALLVAVPLVTVVAGGHPEWRLAVAGGTLILVSIPLNWAFQRHAVNALEEYNKQFESSRIRTNLYFTGTGAKLVLQF
ncbi:MAG TPA: hypothetical protein VK517_15550, partial [Cyclobacteriaceae bacterium]|nr:hypothetical protein [Cyclobacteriaceae bacterium]